MNIINPSISNPLSVGNWYQNLLFYSIITFMIFINLYFIKKKNRKRAPDQLILSQNLNDNEVALNETVDGLTIEVKALRGELMNIGEELELAYAQTDKANNKLLEALDCFSTEVVLPDVGYWSVDLETQELSISENGRLIYGIPKEERLTLTDGLRLVDEEFREDMVNTITQAMKSGKRIVKNYRMTTQDNGESKWLMTSGNITYNDHGDPLRISGSFVITGA
jgi:PAS domain-containing protein